MAFLKFVSLASFGLLQPAKNKADADSAITNFSCFNTSGVLVDNKLLYFKDFPSFALTRTSQSHSPHKDAYVQEMMQHPALIIFSMELLEPAA